MQRIKYYADWLFKNLHGRRGGYVIVETPNLPLIVFMVSIILGVVLYPGFFQKLFIILAYVSLILWSIMEVRGGRSRFRKLLGILGLLFVATAVLLRIGL